MIDPQTVDVFSLPSKILDKTTSLPSKAGVYFVISRPKQIQYIGRSIDLYSRWMAHHRIAHFQEMKNVRIAYLLVNDESLLDPLEQAFIQRFDPPLNTRKSTGKYVGKKRERYSIPLDSSLQEPLRKVAVQQGVTVKDFVTGAVERALEEVKA